MPRILVIDDDETVRDVLNTYLSANGFDVALAANGESGIDVVRGEKFDVVITDLVMPGLSGMEVLDGISSLTVNTPVIMVTAFGTVQTAVEAMKKGAFDYVTKPFVLDELLLTINRALGVSRLQKENIMLKMQLKKKYNFKGLIGDSPVMQKVYEMIEKIADTDSTVLISGESGTGKELVAKTIHYNSARAQGPFVPLNCAAIPRDLLESELFGHEKGAFSGALNTRIGRFELAHNGTLFLDEIGELDPSLQVKLLRVLQENEFERVGGVKTIKVDVRILAATNKNLEEATKQGRFREDLFYRLNVIPLHLPHLRERTEDIQLLTETFLQENLKKRKREPLKFSPEVVTCFKRYGWPGNVRELKNLVERLTILVSGNVVKLSDLPEKFQQGRLFDVERSENGQKRPPMGSADIPEEGIDLNSIVDSMERDLIVKALERTGGVRSRAAALLGLNRTTLIEKMKKMGIEFKRV